MQFMKKATQTNVTFPLKTIVVYDLVHHACFDGNLIIINALIFRETYAVLAQYL